VQAKSVFQITAVAAHRAAKSSAQKAASLSAHSLKKKSKKSLTQIQERN
jgi:hypothetical protein